MSGWFSSRFLLLCLLGSHGLFHLGYHQNHPIEQSERLESQICENYEEAIYDPRLPTLFVFFTTVCPVCWDDLFELKYIIESNDYTVQLVGVTVDRTDDLKRFISKYSFSYPVVIDRKRQLRRKYNIRTEPYMVLVHGETVLFRDDDLEDPKKQREKLLQCLQKYALK